MTGQINKNPSSVNSVSMDESPEDFKTLHTILSRIDAIASPQAVFDGHITLEEVGQCLDQIGTGLTRDDFLMPFFNYSPKMFHRIDSILDRHSMDLSTMIDDWEYSLGHFIETGEAPRAYLSSHRFIKDALKRDGEMLEQVSFERFPHVYEDFVRIALDQNPHAIRFVSQGYQMMHPELIQFVLSRDPTALKALSVQIQLLNPGFVRKSILRVPALLKLTSTLFQISNPDILLEAVNQRGNSLQYIHDGAQAVHQHVVLAALRRRDEAYEYVADSLKENIGFLVKAVLTNFNIYPEISDEDVGIFLKYQIWQKVRAQVEKQQLFFPDGMLNSYESFVSGLEENGVTEFPKRIRSFQTAYELMRNDSPGEEDDRPVALMLFNRDDHNGGFDEYPILDEFVESGFRVIYKEIDHDGDFFHYLEEYTDDGENPVHTLVVGGHGSQTSLHLGKKEEAVRPNSEKLDINDFVECYQKSPIQEGGQIFIYACNNGRGEDISVNLANSIGSSFPDDITIYSQPITGNILTMDIKEDLSLDLKFWVSKDDETNTFHDPYMVSRPYVIRPGDERTLGR